jgi:DNA-binding NarL/FixJ family response regulator
MKKIAIIEDHPLIENGLRSILNNIWRDVNIESFDKIEALENSIINSNSYDLIIADIHLGDVNILERILLIQIENKHIKIIIYTSSHPWELGIQKDKFPFFGYIQKSADSQHLINCIQSAESEISFLSDDLVWHNPMSSLSNNIIITKREKEILTLIKSGKTNKEIGEVLFLSELTIKSHRQNMMRKFDAKNVAELIDKTSHLFYSY